MVAQGLMVADMECVVWLRWTAGCVWWIVEVALSLVGVDDENRRSRWQCWRDLTQLLVEWKVLMFGLPVGSRTLSDECSLGCESRLVAWLLAGSAVRW